MKPGGIHYDIATINAEIDATNARLDALRLERDAALLADFDAGVTVTDIARRAGMPLATVWTILWKSGRRQRKRQTPISHLPEAVQKTYAKLRHNGIGKEAARQMAAMLVEHNAAYCAGRDAAQLAATVPA